MSAPNAPNKPAHVPDRLVVDLDLFNLKVPAGADPQAALSVFRDKGEILWSPHMGGAWILTRSEDIKAVQNDWQHFTRVPSQERLKMLGMRPSPPNQLDPPKHTAYRRPLTKALLPNVVEKMSEKVTTTVIELIESFVDRGECEFVEDFGRVFPILIFLDLVDLPRSDRTHLLPLAEALVRATPKDRLVAFDAVADYLRPIIAERQANPGDDLFSILANTEVDEAKLDLEDAVNFCRTVLGGGLDTVASMLGFATRHFAMHPELRREFVENINDERFVRNVVEEMLRRYPLATTRRFVSKDMEFKGVRLVEGDMILTPNAFVGLDADLNEAPLDAILTRDTMGKHAAFDVGPHTCPGASLARRELKIFLEEWFKRIPDFGIKPGTTPEMVTGLAFSVAKLDLVWPARG